MAIYVFNKGEQEHIPFVYQSIKEHNISRFGWSWFDDANLLELTHKNWKDLTKDEIEVKSKSNFLLNIKEGDWIVHINVPSYGRCVAGKVAKTYFFDNDSTVVDFRHCLGLEEESIVEFNRNDNEVHPLISRKLKLRGRYWKIYAENEFFESIEKIKSENKLDKLSDTKGVFYLKNEIEPIFEEITNKIQKTHPEKKLEYLICDIFKKIPNVTEAYVNGSGWGTDFGADVIVKYNSGLGILNLQHEETLVIQVKSYTGHHNDINSVNQIKTAINRFKADCGLLITTAKSTEKLEQKIEELSNEIKKPVELIAGGDVAKFLLKFQHGLLYDL